MTDSRLSRWPLSMALVAAVAVVGAPLGYRVSVLPLGPTFLLLLAGVLISIVVLPVALTVVVRRRRLPGSRRPGMMALAAAISAVAGLGPLLFVLSALGAPAIHDITTDTDDPPRFEAVVAVRADGANSLEYGGAEVAAAQRDAYPDLATVVVSQAPDRALDLAREVAEELGWEIVAVDPDAGRLEATDTTFWFGFADDIVVRVRPAASGCRVDLRSVSRVGVGDAGANAARLRVFIRRFEARAAG